MTQTRLPSVTACRVCGGGDFALSTVLWDRLIAEWQLAPAEIAYLDRQQGFHCIRCGAVLRVMALAEAIGRSLGHAGPLIELPDRRDAPAVRILGVNSIPSLSPILARIPGYREVAYPAIDMMDMDLPDGSVDLIVHSDTLEHIPQPRRALAECRRVLAPGGSCCFSVPVLHGRLTRSREGLPKSYHGAPGIELDDFVVHTEFGADIWSIVLEAGFRACEIVALEVPAGIAFRAQS